MWKKNGHLQPFESKFSTKIDGAHLSNSYSWEKMERQRAMEREGGREIGWNAPKNEKISIFSSHRANLVNQMQRCFVKIENQTATIRKVRRLSILARRTSLRVGNGCYVCIVCDYMQLVDGLQWMRWYSKRLFEKLTIKLGRTNRFLIWSIFRHCTP